MASLNEIPSPTTEQSDYPELLIKFILQNTHPLSHYHYYNHINICHSYRRRAFKLNLCNQDSWNLAVTIACKSKTINNWKVTFGQLLINSLGQLFWSLDLSSTALCVVIHFVDVSIAGESILPGRRLIFTIHPDFLSLWLKVTTHDEVQTTFKCHKTTSLHSTFLSSVFLSLFLFIAVFQTTGSHCHPHSNPALAFRK